MFRTVLFAGAVAITTGPVDANQTQLAHSAGVQPGLYSTGQVQQLIQIDLENGSQAMVHHILANPEGGKLVPRLSTTTRSPESR